jgi:uncharacterized phage-associated protein
MSGFPFNFTKTLQAVATLLRRERGQCMSVLRILKLLYIADREALRETGRTITGDKIVAMKYGPVLSRLYDLVKGEDILAPQWDQYMEKDGYQVSLAQDPGNGSLTRYDIEKIEEVCARYREMSDWDIVDETHGFPEWIKNDPGNSSKRIPLDDVLEAVGQANNRDAILKDARAATSLTQLFGG